MRRPVLLDGGTATELHRAGVRIGPPGWTVTPLTTAPSRAELTGVHRRFAAAGAAVVTAGTFHCHARTLGRLGLPRRIGRSLVRVAVGLARQSGAPLIAASLSPVEDCYRPDLVPPDDRLRDEHRWLAGELVAAGVDVVLVETMNSAREARIAVEAALGAAGHRGVMVWVGLACAPGPGRRPRLLAGDDLARTAAALERDGAGAVLVNCAPAADTGRLLDTVRQACRGPVGAYPNLEDRAGVYGHTERALPSCWTPDRFADAAAGWVRDGGADLVGGCCGTGPEHLDALRAVLAHDGRIASGHDTPLEA